MDFNEIFPGVYSINGRIAVKSSLRGFSVHGEQILQLHGSEYREWNPFQSKLAAALTLGLKNFPFARGSKVLYLGAANGVTCSFLSDVVGDGEIYAVEFSAQASRDLIRVSEKKLNVFPIVEDARFPERYAEIVPEVDVLFEDVADRGQVQILKENSEMFLKSGALALLAVKARCIDSSRPPKQVYSQVISELQPDFEVLEKIVLDKFEKDHLFLVLRKKDMREAMAGTREADLVVRKVERIDEEIDAGKRKLYSLGEVERQSRLKKK